MKTFNKWYIGLLFISTTVMAEDTLITAENSECQLWVDSSDSVEWDGRCIDGKASGHGTVIYKKKGEVFSTYEGEMKNGYPNGAGVATFPDGMSRAGIYINAYLNGHGMQTFPDGKKFIGEFKDNLMHGQGVAYNEDGSIFHDGEWENGLPKNMK